MALEWKDVIESFVKFGADIKDNTEAGKIKKGYFIGIDSNGKAVLADSGEGDASAVEARGVALDDGTYGTSDTTAYFSRIAFVREGKLYGFSGLTPGGDVYLSSGGGITQTAPTKSGAIKQKVGFALSADTIWVDIQPAETVS